MFWDDKINKHKQNLPSFINIYFALYAIKIQQVKSGCKCITKFFPNKKNTDIFKPFIHILTAY